MLVNNELKPRSLTGQNRVKYRLLIQYGSRGGISRGYRPHPCGVALYIRAVPHDREPLSRAAAHRTSCTKRYEHPISWYVERTSTANGGPSIGVGPAVFVRWKAVVRPVPRARGSRNPRGLSPGLRLRVVEGPDPVQEGPLGDVPVERVRLALIHSEYWMRTCRCRNSTG